jgi:hypothetical protein
VANPYSKPLLIFLPTGTFTLQDTPSFPRRDSAFGSLRFYSAVLKHLAGTSRNISFLVEASLQDETSESPKEKRKVQKTHKPNTENPPRRKPIGGLKLFISG